MRLYRNLVAASIKALNKIFTENQLADRVVQTTLRSNKKWGSKDRRFLAATIYDAVRWYRLHYEILGHEPESTEDWWKALGIMWTLQGEELPAWEHFEGLNTEEILAKKETLSTVLKIKASIPDWLDDLGRKELGEKWAACIEASNEPAELVLRANSLKTTTEELIINLDKKGVVAAEMDLPSAVILPVRKKLTNFASYERGYFEIQDASSQQVAPFLGVKRGMTVVDACAGAGGKSLHIGALMENEGEIISLDVDDDKLNELYRRAKRAAISILKTKTITDDSSVIEDLYDRADRLLLDAPCSGLGTLKRSPHIKWRLTPEFLEKIKATQQEILQHYSPICKKGGQLVYATCSILPSENQEQVKTFLASAAGSDFRLIKDKQILPDEGFDGFYMALLERV
ncbi:MAG: RNA methyltransferase [uncultured Aureispira sp.]|uniref:RNA methyltransferase n=1 Tax=uncultured Aureispira sp. TaxID=1331704 RepID=A0A6S6U5K4_9BACT|nr:MAG: RNA methyltransferase [uncultured Aureispira sp.]